MIESTTDLLNWLRDNQCFAKTKVHISFSGPSWVTFETEISEEELEKFRELGGKYKLERDSEWTLAKREITWLMETLLEWKMHRRGIVSENTGRLFEFIDELLKIKSDVQGFHTLISISL